MKNEFTVTEELMIFIVDKREKRLTHGSDHYQTITIISSIFYELLMNEFIFMDDKELIVINDKKERPKSPYVSIIYDIISESQKPRKMSYWIQKLKDNKEIFNIITDELIAQGCISEYEQKVFLFTQKKMKCDEDIIDRQIQRIRAEFLEDGTITSETAFETFMLNKNNILKNFFSKYENNKLKQRLNEIKDEPIGKIAKYVIDSIDAVIAIIVATS